MQTLNDASLKEAFLFAPDLGDLGRVPLNLVALGCLGILGFGHPAFWLVAAIGELIYLPWVASRPWFKRRLQSRDSLMDSHGLELRRRRLMLKIPGRDRWRLQRFEQKCGQLIEATRDLNGEGSLWPDDLHQLRRTRWMYLKLLLAQNALRESQGAVTANSLESRVEVLERELEASSLSAGARESKQETLRLYKSRLANRARRSVGLEEIAAELERLDAQLDLALEGAALDRREALRFEVELTRRLLESAEYGEHEEAVRGLDWELDGSGGFSG